MFDFSLIVLALIAAGLFCWLIYLRLMNLHGVTSLRREKEYVLTEAIRLIAINQQTAKKRGRGQW